MAADRMFDGGDGVRRRRRDVRQLGVASCAAVFHRIGHGGASALAPANTLASFDAAVAVGVDMVEFDVRGRGRELVLAHTALDARRAAAVRLHEALRHLAQPRFAHVELNVDVKHVGSEAAVLDALRSAGLTHRALLSSQVPAVLDQLRRLDAGARIGISVGGRLARLSRRWGDWRAAVLGGLTHRRWDALMVQHRLIDERLLAGVCDRGGLLYAWTVNERRAIQALAGLGVHGITTADPRLFQGASAEPGAVVAPGPVPGCVS